MYKGMFLLLAVLFSHPLNAEVIYNDLHERNLGFTLATMQDLVDGGCREDIKCKYLSALHEVRVVYIKEKGVQKLESLAALGVLDAKHSLYEISSWVGVNDLSQKKALNYLKEAAEDGYAPSQVELARAYIKGAFGKSDPEKAHYWLVKAAEQGHADALIYTANGYFIGRGVPKDDKKGFEWLIKAYDILGGDLTNGRC